MPCDTMCTSILFAQLVLSNLLGQISVVSGETTPFISDTMSAPSSAECNMPSSDVLLSYVDSGTSSGGIWPPSNRLLAADVLATLISSLRIAPASSIGYAFGTNLVNNTHTETAVDGTMVSFVTNTSNDVLGLRIQSVLRASEFDIGPADPAEFILSLSSFWYPYSASSIVLQENAHRQRRSLEELHPTRWNNSFGLLRPDAAATQDERLRRQASVNLIQLCGSNTTHNCQCNAAEKLLLVDGIGIWGTQCQCAGACSECSVTALPALDAVDLVPNACTACRSTFALSFALNGCMSPDGCHTLRSYASDTLSPESSQLVCLDMINFSFSCDQHKVSPALTPVSLPCTCDPGCNVCLHDGTQFSGSCTACEHGLALNLTTGRCVPVGTCAYGVTHRSDGAQSAQCQTTPRDPTSSLDFLLSPTSSKPESVLHIAAGTTQSTLTTAFLTDTTLQESILGGGLGPGEGIGEGVPLSFNHVARARIKLYSTHAGV